MRLSQKIVTALQNGDKESLGLNLDLIQGDVVKYINDNFILHSAITMATTRKHLEVVQFLLDYNPDLYKQHPSSNNTILDLAVSFATASVVKGEAAKDIRIEVVVLILQREDALPKRKDTHLRKENDLPRKDTQPLREMKNEMGQIPLDHVTIAKRVHPTLPDLDYLSKLVGDSKSLKENKTPDAHQNLDGVRHRKPVHGSSSSQQHPGSTSRSVPQLPTDSLNSSLTTPTINSRSSARPPVTKPSAMTQPSTPSSSGFFSTITSPLGTFFSYVTGKIYSPSNATPKETQSAKSDQDNSNKRDPSNG